MQEVLKFLIDTNIFISAEPTSPGDVEPITPAVAAFMRLVEQEGHSLAIHPASLEDLRRDPNKVRRHMREMLLKKYVHLEPPPAITPRLISIIGEAYLGTQDVVDHALIAAIDAEAVDYLITEDRRLRKKAIRAGFYSRVATVGEAINLLKSLFEVIPPTPPAVRRLSAYEINHTDPIFDSIRQDYQHDFDEWLIKCKREHRLTWIIPGKKGNYAGIFIVKKEELADYDIPGKVLKICMFKVSDSYRGLRFGELLLKTAFQYAKENDFENMYITVFPKYEGLIILFEEFGFDISHQKEKGELVLVKPMKFDQADYDSLAGLDFHIRYGPFRIKFPNVPGFIIPIKPKYHRLLFPDAEPQLELYPGQHPFGNSIRKAYLCHARMRDIEPGSLLLFYRSKDLKAVSCLGVAEETKVSNRAEEIARFVGKRTVYTFKEIEDMCQKTVFSILFRHARILPHPIPLAELIEKSIIKGIPQTITRLRSEAMEWLRTRINE